MLQGTPRSAAETTPRTEADLEERLSRPTREVCETLSTCPGDVIVLGAGGKMGPSLTLMLQRAVEELGDSRTVVAVSRFASGSQGDRLAQAGVRVIRADLSESAALVALPEAPNVIYMAGQKFGTRDAPALTWFTNVVVPAQLAARYAASRIVAFSTGNVYPLTPVGDGGSREGDLLAPVGDYAASCVGRERVLEHAALARGTPVAIVRLNYAVDLRYGVLVDLAQKVLSGAPIDLRMGTVNCIWQGDANGFAIGCLAHATTPAFVLNVTGNEMIAVRDASLELGRLLGREPLFVGTEAPDALLSNTTRMQSLFGLPSVSASTLITWVAEWLLTGGRTLGRATKFEEREGQF